MPAFLILAACCVPLAAAAVVAAKGLVSRERSNDGQTEPEPEEDIRTAGRRPGRLAPDEEASQ